MIAIGIEKGQLLVKSVQLLAVHAVLKKLVILLEPQLTHYQNEKVVIDDVIKFL